MHGRIRGDPIPDRRSTNSIQDLAGRSIFRLVSRLNLARIKNNNLDLCQSSNEFEKALFPHMNPPSGPNKKADAVELTTLLTSLIAASYAFGVYLFSTLLPDMRQALALSYTEIGWITGVAQIGFLLGAFGSTRLVRAMGTVRTILSSVAAPV